MNSGMSRFRTFSTIAMLALPQVLGQSCPSIEPSAQSVMADGYSSAVVMNGLSRPRHLIFDTEGNLLLIEGRQGGVRHIKLTDNGNVDVCVGEEKELIEDASLNHGIDLSSDGTNLFVSSADQVYSYPYDAAAGTVGEPTVLVTGMNSTSHSTRTIHVSRKFPDLMVVSRGSTGNLDNDTVNIDSARAQIRVFNITEASANSVPYDEGKVLGWGLRNSVGIAEDRSTGEIWSVENSSDNLIRDDVDVHNTNPAEELNYHGSLDATDGPEYGANYGYPLCVTAWDPESLSMISDLQVGTQFVIGTPSGDTTDEMCRTERHAPRLAFQAHTAPLDIKFNSNGSFAYIAFHGSWNRDPAEGFRLSRVEFANGQPVAESTSTGAEIPIMENQDQTQCPDGCFRPTGLAWDRQGRLFMTSDATGELWVVAGPLGQESTAPSATPTPPSSAHAFSANIGVLAALMAAMTWLLM